MYLVIKMKITVKQTTLESLDGLLKLRIDTGTASWESAEVQPYMVHDTLGKLSFSSAKSKEESQIDTGFGKGIQMRLANFPHSSIALTLTALIEESSQQITLSISADTEDEHITELFWPAPFAFSNHSNRWYTLLPIQQGLLIPNTWKTEVNKLPFDGQLCTSSAYMPWLAQIKDGHGYLAIALTPWDGGYQIDHPADETYTHVSFRWLSSLAQLRYTRSVRYTFLDQADYVKICKLYQDYAKETGCYTTLREKELRNPLVSELAGCAVVHKGIKTYVRSDSDFYDPQAPEKNNSLTTFEERRNEILQYQAKGVKKLYLHLDGWAQPGYDNAHPDYFPVCEEAGGSKGLLALFDTITKAGYLLGLHDQYRDYYHHASSYHEDMAVHRSDHAMPSHQHWAGGMQSYLCSSLAPSFVKRNFQYLFDAGIHPQASYLDVFTCNEPDECDHPWHRVTRKESLAYRTQCFSWLESKGILTSSEEANEWALRHLVFAHYGPYESMMHAPDTPTLGIDVPLFNLVYHACMMLPWPMERIKGHDDQMLLALLNGGLPYLEKDGAYPNTDGVFAETYEQLSLEEKICRSKIVQELHEQVAFCDMTAHEFLDDTYQLQRTTFSDGTIVTIDLNKQTYSIKKP